MTPSTTAADARRARVQAIRDAATVRAALGQAAAHRRLDDGRHEVTIGGRLGIGDTLDEAISEVRRHE
jgi:hypothetical protein